MAKLIKEGNREPRGLWTVEDAVMERMLHISSFDISFSDEMREEAVIKKGRHNEECIRHIIVREGD